MKYGVSRDLIYHLPVTGLRRRNGGGRGAALAAGVLLAAVAGAGLPAGAAATAPCPPAAMARPAIQQFRAHQAGAAAALAALATRYPHCWLPAFYRGRLAARRQRPVQAALLLTRAARLAPRQPQPRAALAVLAGEQGFWEDAAAEWQRYLQLAPGDGVAWRELAMAAQMSQQTRLALRAMRHYLAARPGDARGQYLYALMLHSAGELPQAREAIGRAVTLGPRLATAWTTQALWQLQANDLAAARQSLRAALAAAPNQPRALAELAQWERRTGHAELALPLLLRAQSLAPEDAMIAYELAQTDLALHNTQEARAARREFQRLRAAQRQPVGDVRAPTLLGWARQEAGRTPAERQADYLALLRQLNRRDPGQPRVLCRLGHAEWAAGERARARQHLAQALAAGPSYADAVRTAAWLAQSGESQRARRFYQEALRQPEAASLATAAVGLARLDLDAGQYAAALAVATAVPAAAEPRGAAAEVAALAYAALGQPTAAQAAFRLALTLRPKRVEWYREDAIFLGGVGKWTAALQVLQVGSRQCGPSLRLELTRAILLQLSGRRSEAQAQLQRVIAAAGKPGQQQTRRQAQLLLAISYMTTSQGELAAPILRAVNRQSPEMAEAWYYRARLERQNGQTTVALRHARRAARLRPDYAPAWLLAGRLEEARGGSGVAAAAADYRRAAQAEPDWTAPHQALRNLYLREGQTAAARAEQKTVAALQSKAPAAAARQMQSALLGLAAQ